MHIISTKLLNLGFGGFRFELEKKQIYVDDFHK